MSEAALKDVLQRWWGAEIAELCALRPQRGEGVLLGCPVWGKAYIERFLRFGLPSILAQENVAALRDWSRFVFWTDASGVSPLWNATREWPFDPPQIRPIPPQVLEMIQQAEDRVAAVASVQSVPTNVAIHMAARSGMGFHWLLADQVYSRRYFAVLRALSSGEDGISQASISADVGCMVELEKHRQGGVIEIDARDLGDIGWRHLHLQMSPYLMRGLIVPQRMPNSGLLIWPARDRLHLAFFHQHVSWLSPRLCARAPSIVGGSLDTKLPFYMGENAYVPGADDGLTFIELSDASKKAGAPPVDFEAYARNFWLMCGFRDEQMPFFEARSGVPIHAQRTDYMEEEEIERQHRLIVDKLKGCQAQLALEEMQKRAGPEWQGRPSLRQQVDVVPMAPSEVNATARAIIADVQVREFRDRAAVNA